MVIAIVFDGDIPLHLHKDQIVYVYFYCNWPDVQNVKRGFIPLTLGLVLKPCLQN
ncbi:protein of unknown function [Candidatus Nitrosocosmicus franklandus]|uniref:Uncharacterized protein n=1 Tax=Candidatus Nitrosocosmicus franklandianus TaxID=1798806 RepID=A0A484I7R3_9ARCH|nr:protein of unknown function [Candidatus Nitrosocosmicus franklandus]